MNRIKILELVKNNKSASLFKKKIFKEEVLPYIKNNTPDIVKNERPKVILYWYVNNLQDYPRCEEKDCKNKVTRLPNGEDSKYGKCCSSKCSGLYTSQNMTEEQRKLNGLKTKKTYDAKTDEERKTIVDKIKKGWFSKDRKCVVEKRKKTCLTRYGVDNPMKNKDILDKSIQTKEEKYGCVFINDKKAKETKLRLYGDENYNNPRKISSTNKVVWGSSTELRIDQIKSTNQEEKYKKHVDTIKRKYNVTNISQIPEVQDKKLKTGYRSKDYIFPSGKIIKVQGYEGKLLDELITEYGENDIYTNSVDMPELYYIGEDDKEHRYFPDVYIPSTNTIYEVKSTYTVSVNVEKNKRKFKSVIDAGYKFKLKIY